MKIPKRFALSTLLLMMLLVSLVFGYAQWRRQWLIGEVKSLNAMDGRMIVGEGVSFENMATLPSFAIRDGFWPSVRVAGDFVVHDNLFSQSFASGRVPVCFAKMRDGTYRLGGDSHEYGAEELRARLSGIEARLHSVGLDDIEFWEYEDLPNYVGRSVTTDVNSIGE